MGFEVRGFWSLRGGDEEEVSKKDDPPPKDNRLADEFDRLCVWLTVLEFVDFDHRLRLTPWSTDVTGFMLGALCERGPLFRSLLGRALEKEADLVGD